MCDQTEMYYFVRVPSCSRPNVLRRTWKSRTRIVTFFVIFFWWSNDPPKTRSTFQNRKSDKLFRPWLSGEIRGRRTECIAHYTWLIPSSRFVRMWNNGLRRVTRVYDLDRSQNRVRVSLARLFYLMNRNRARLGTRGINQTAVRQPRDDQTYRGRKLFKLDRIPFDVSADRYGAIYARVTCYVIFITGFRKIVSFADRFESFRCGLRN